MSDALKEIIKRASAFLRTLGFKGTGRNYVLLEGEAACVVNFQKSAGGQHFFVNVGVQLLRVPNAAHQMTDLKSFKEESCIFRTRLDPPPEQGAGWANAPSVADDLIAGLETLIHRFVKPLMQVPGVATEASVNDFPIDGRHPILGPRHAGRFLHHARIALAYGKTDHAIEFATEALAICPPRATSLKDRLEELLESARTAD